MSRYIDADAYLNILCGICLKDKRDGRCDDDCMVAGAVNTAPSIDIVRCKECRWGKPYSDKQLECDALGLGGLKFPDDFCNYGERSNK